VSLAIQGIFDRADAAAKPNAGRVTIRRLNRTEYNNTIRDLLGVDFKPADDFPADDVGYGFDNIGDVLSVSPLLLEKYLAAAETIWIRSSSSRTRRSPRSGRSTRSARARSAPRARSAKRSPSRKATTNCG
jgi:hypothetical protein